MPLGNEISVYYVPSVLAYFYPHVLIHIHVVPFRHLIYIWHQGPVMFLFILLLQRRGRSGSQVSSGPADGLDDTFEPWSSKCPAILARYTTSEKLSITTSFLSGADKGDDANWIEMVSLAGLGVMVLANCPY